MIPFFLDRLYKIKLVHQFVDQLNYIIAFVFLRLLLAFFELGQMLIKRLRP